MHCLRIDRRLPGLFAVVRLSAAALSLFLSTCAFSAELADVERLYRTGKYAECAQVAAAEIKDGVWDAAWPVFQAKAELAQGKYPAALRTVEEALEQYGASLELRLLAVKVYRFNNDAEKAAQIDEETGRLIGNQLDHFRSPSDRVSLGRFLLEHGGDPRQILELVYDPVRKGAPDYPGVYYATAELALDKCDNALAAETLQGVPKPITTDPQYQYLLARAYSADEPARAQQAIDAALAENPNHLDSRLMRIDVLIDAEEYAAAESQLDRVLEVNSNHPIAWAYKAVVAHLKANTKSEEAARKQALAAWPKNPEVDHLIGRKLSEKYRFAEGAEYQRKALACDRGYRPAKLQLSQDLLRLGEEAEGWRLADEVAKQDAYDVVAFNLVTLEDELKKYRTIQGDGLAIRMEAREADLYGKRALELLTRARRTLCEKYEVKLDAPIVIEIFAKQKDFDVRTFGMPGVARGYLGVCFGRVVTANSPASQGEHPSNWESVLWHEFCHVVTLHKTRNKMPRWLSEGISVYEERQANPAWGQTMNEQYREFILGGQMTPVSELSSAFMAPESPVHLQFAYYESSLVVEYLIEQFGIDKLRDLLDDLGAGRDINEALVLHTAPLNRLDADFTNYARKRAEKLAIRARFDDPELPEGADALALAKWLEQHPNNVPALKKTAIDQVRQDKFQDAVNTAKHLREIYPSDVSADSSYALLAKAYRGLKDVDAEQEALEQIASRTDDATDAYARLAELAESKEDWAGVAKNAERILAVNPLVPAPHRLLARAAEKLGRRDDAIRANEALLKFDTTDIAETHFRLATLLSDTKDRDAARRHAIMALEEAPRFLDAHKLLLKLANGDTVQPVPVTQTPPASSETNAPLKD
jgi:tetratricopeptide (TPR) repeat protein